MVMSSIITEFLPAKHIQLISEYGFTDTSKDMHDFVLKVLGPYM